MFYLFRSHMPFLLLDFAQFQCLLQLPHPRYQRQDHVWATGGDEIPILNNFVWKSMTSNCCKYTLTSHNMANSRWRMVAVASFPRRRGLRQPGEGVQVI